MISDFYDRVHLLFVRVIDSSGGWRLGVNGQNTLTVMNAHQGQWLCRARTG